MGRYNALEDEEDVFEPLELEAPVRRGMGPIGKRETFRFVEDPKTKALTVLDVESGIDYQLANPLEYPRGKHASEDLFDMWFDQHSPIHVLVWARHFEQAFEQAAEFLDGAGLKGYFVSDEDMKSYYDEALEEIKESGEDLDEEEMAEKAQEQAEVDLTYTESGYIPSGDWGGQEADRSLYAAAFYASAIEYTEQYGEDE